MRELPFKKQAEDFLTVAKRILSDNGKLIPVVNVMSGSLEDGLDIEVYGMVHGNDAEKYACYRGLWEKVLPSNPACIVMINDSYIFHPASGTGLKDKPTSLALAYRNGDPAVAQCIMMTVFPRGNHAWAINQPYDDRGPDKKIVFGEPVTIANETGTDIGGGLGPRPWTRQTNLRVDAMMSSGGRAQ